MYRLEGWVLFRKDSSFELFELAFVFSTWEAFWVSHLLKLLTTDWASRLCLSSFSCRISSCLCSSSLFFLFFCSMTAWTSLSIVHSEVCLISHDILTVLLIALSFIFFNIPSSIRSPACGDLLISERFLLTIFSYLARSFDSWEYLLFLTKLNASLYSSFLYISLYKTDKFKEHCKLI